MKRKPFLVGLFVVVSFIVTIWLILFIRPSFGDKKTKLTVRFVNVAGINKGTRVTYGGKAVGQVKKISLIPLAQRIPATVDGYYYIYETVLEVDSSVRIHTQDTITFVTSGLLGEKSIEITPISALDSEDITNNILYSDAQDPLQELVDHVKSTTHHMNETLQNMDLILSHLNQPLQEMIHHINALLQRAYSPDTSIGKLFNSDEFYQQLLATIHSIEQVCDDIHNYGLLFQYNKKWQRKNYQLHSSSCTALYTLHHTLKQLPAHVVEDPLVQQLAVKTQEALHRLQTQTKDFVAPLHKN